MARDTDRISNVYQYFFLYIEPLSALLGAYYSFLQQQTYLELTHAPTAPTYGIPKSTQVVLNQLANLYLLFALNEALVLRVSSDLRTWQALILCLLIADFGHLYSVSGLGLQVYWNVPSWNAIDWANVGFVYAGVAIRICFLYGLGVATPKHRGSNATPRRSPRKSRPAKKSTS